MKNRLYGDDLVTKLLSYLFVLFSLILIGGMEAVQSANLTQFAMLIRATVAIFAANCTVSTCDCWLNVRANGCLRIFDGLIGLRICCIYITATANAIVRIARHDLSIWYCLTVKLKQKESKCLWNADKSRERIKCVQTLKHLDHHHHYWSDSYYL